MLLYYHQSYHHDLTPCLDRMHPFEDSSSPLLSLVCGRRGLRVPGCVWWVQLHAAPRGRWSKCTVDLDRFAPTCLNKNRLLLSSLDKNRLLLSLLNESRLLLSSLDENWFLSSLLNKNRLVLFWLDSSGTMKHTKIYSDNSNLLWPIALLCTIPSGLHLILIYNFPAKWSVTTPGDAIRAPIQAHPGFLLLTWFFTGHT